MTTIANKPLVLVDGSSYLYRAFHALPPLTNSKGEPTGAVYGVINMLKRLLKDYEPELVAVVFDPKGKTFREELYPDYKANRPAMPEELRLQIPPLFEVIKAMGLSLIIVDGVEADDVIGTLTVHALQHNLSVLISTGDKDMAQLVNDKVTLINTMTNKLYDRAGVIEKFGIPPEKIIDYLTLVGDSVDNVPGVPKVGPKTAVKWLEEFESLDNIIANKEKISGKIGENLRSSVEHLPLSKQLVTIKTDVALNFDYDDLKIKPANVNELKELFKRLEFKSWLAEAIKQQEEVPHSNSQQQPYQCVLNEKDFDTLLAKLGTISLLAIDTETTSLNAIDAELVGVSLATAPGEGYYIPLAHRYLDAPVQLDREKTLEKLKPILENPHIKKIGHNLKYDLEILAKYNIHVQGVAFDTMLEAFLVSSGNRLDLDTMVLKYLGHRNITFEEVAGKGAKQITFDFVDIDTATKYASEDADMALQLHHKLWPAVEKHKGIKYIFEQVEMPLVPILAKIEMTGVLIDAEKLNAQSQDLAIRIQNLEQEAYQLVGSVFNINSPKQLQEILYDKLKLPILQKTPTGQPSTAEDVLQELAHDYPLPKLILNYRSLSKLKSTYTDKLPLQINARTGRVHTSYHQAGAATGRFSSSDPNLQNIPTRHEEGRRIRQAFIAPAGYKILAADYSQIELRIMAHLSKDEGLCTAFAKGLDIHKATAAEVFAVPLNEVTPLQRRSAKAINFGLIYGMSAFGLAKQLEVDRKEAQAFMDRYFTRYPQVKIFMETIRQQAHELGYVETLFGRRLYLPEINSRNKAMQNAMERAAVNAPMQGTAADIIKLAMIKMDEALLESKLDVKMIMQVHDELVFEVNESSIEPAKALIKQVMENVVKLSVPLEVGIGIGSNWDESH